MEKFKTLRTPKLLQGAGKQWHICSSFFCDFVRTLHREKIFLLFGGFFVLIFLGGIGFALYEPDKGTFWTRLGVGLWWAIVTITTVGYGDVVPQTIPGRLVGVCLMISGLVSISLVTATVASIFVQRKLRREKGLEAGHRPRSCYHSRLE